MSTDRDHVEGAGTDQHPRGFAERGTFTTDEPPAADTPADGSSNAGINARRANRPGADDDPQAMPTGG
ncbi:hypothetical protein [Actinoplanes teichomyceticus]|uniref:Uncharacterized protein n=1 Tax=Actinoplanes teichomyceticus TaxID=1867 RepID=A0A561VMI6_ACTTI|nr:hypothetical protein [Actinoplanes teichomyceticus]TWG12834.1 hypothetical protein FHX34_105702 [Actinoplanes teichomyceticus]GIF13581.1 hypothetical protein Ate01nite_36130 [Actinoplanes teichomyceticus]